jgi:predicted RNA methylase
MGLFRGLILDLDLQHESQIYAGLAEAETHRYVRKAAHRCRWMIDVGAGQGELALYFAANSIAKEIFAIEPNASQLDILSRNLALNSQRGAERVAIVRKFAGVELSDNSVRLDDLPVLRTDRGFIKIDVDGHEVKVLQGAMDLLSTAPLDVLIETHSAELERDCISLLKAKGYAPKIIRNAWWRMLIPERRSIDHNRWLWAGR